jgi:hypothetical protein
MQRFLASLVLLCACKASEMTATDPDGGAVDGAVDNPTHDGGSPPDSMFEDIPAEAPAWVADIGLGEWSSISLNKMADVDPEKDPDANPNYPGGAPWHANSGQKCVLNCWNGGAFATRFGTHGALLAFGGGHSGYNGSEVYAFDMASRMWTRVTDPYAGPFNFPYASGTFPDGSAIPMHTYDMVDYHPATNSFVVMKSITDGGPGTVTVAIPVVHMLDLDTKQWRSSPSNSAGSLTGGANSCYDSNRDVFWALSRYSPESFITYDPKGANADGTFGSFSNIPTNATAIDAGAACDPDNDIYVYTQFRYEQAIYARNLADPTAPRVKLTEAGTPPVKEAASGFEWSQRRQAFIYWRRGAGVYELKLTSGTWATGTWTWTNLTAASNTVVPEEMVTDNGVYSRFRIAKYAGAEVAVVVNNVGGAVYAFRIP